MSDYKSARDAAWRAMSRYVRIRECINTTGSVEYGKCVTCGEVKPFDKLDAGHFVPGCAGYAMWDERNVHIQCSACNRFHGGRVLEYRDWMIARYGEAVVEELRERARMMCKYTANDLREMAKSYRIKTKQLEESR